MAQVPRSEKAEFVNNTEGYIGVVTYAPNGVEKPIAVEPRGTVWLSVDEQELTAKAPRLAADNPFIPHQVPIIDPDSGEPVVDKAGRPVTRTLTPLTLNNEQRPIPGNNSRPIPGTGKLRPEAQRALAAESDSDAPDGTHAPTEEVGSPEAQKPAAKRRRRAPTPA